MIRWYDNLPVLSFLMLAGRCRACRTPISRRYPLVELATGAAFVLQGVLYADEPVVLLQRLVLTALLVALFGTDLETQRLPNVLTLPGLLAGVVCSVLVPPGVVAALLGATLGAAIPWLIRAVWYWLKGVEAMGLGDVKMLAMIGAFLGWQQVWVVLLLASVAGAVVGVALAAFGGRSLEARLPFGTFLAVAAFISAVAGEAMLDWYLRLYP
jgi:leader peptidase (prepilin peptidase)/N-methyltransferase